MVSVALDEDIDRVIKDLLRDPSVEAAQPDYILEGFSITVESPGFSSGILSLPAYPEEQWALSNTGQYVNGRQGIVGVDTGLYPFMATEPPLNPVIIAVVDTGIDTDNPSLYGKILPGWDFVNDDSTVFDSGDSYHGTQIAAIIAANGEDGMYGAAENAQIMPLKFIQDGYGYTSDALAAIVYAKENGAKIINCSWGSTVFNPALENIIAENNDILFVCAAGNYGDSILIYPAAYDLPNVVSVASINNSGYLAATSNYGEKVDIAAPGEEIYTVSVNGGEHFVSGTSMAAGYISAAAGIYIGLYTDASPIQVKSALKVTATRTNKLTGFIQSNGYLCIAALTGVQEVTDIEDSSPYDFGELPADVLELLSSEEFYTSLSPEQKELLLQYAHLRDDTMSAFETAGYCIKNSVNKALITQILDISLTDTLSMITTLGDENLALNNASIFRRWQYKYEWLTGDFVTELVKLIVKGYSTKDVVYSAIAAQALGIGYEDILLIHINAH